MLEKPLRQRGKINKKRNYHKNYLSFPCLKKHNNYIVYQFIYFLPWGKVGQIVPSMQPPPVTTPFSLPMIPPPLPPSIIAA
mmetsp:Transcript_13442/g.15192  ORF Transcript_13442/g.15192 Transcript_13442/m.15192 type:complete len:81 (+) Transcript_13442:31-273(+)